MKAGGVWTCRNVRMPPWLWLAFLGGSGSRASFGQQPHRLMSASLTGLATDSTPSGFETLAVVRSRFPSPHQLHRGSLSWPRGQCSDLKKQLASCSRVSGSPHLGKIGFDTAENEPDKNWQDILYIFLSIKPAKRRLSEPKPICTINPSLTKVSQTEKFKGEEYLCIERKASYST